MADLPKLPKRLTLKQINPEAKARLVPAAFKPPTIDFKSGGADSEVSYSMEGMGSLIENMDMLPEIYKDAAGFEMAEIMAEVIQDAKANYVPIETGALSDSGASDEYVRGRGISVVEISAWFGAPGGPSGGMSSGAVSIGVSAATQAGLHAVKDPSEYALDQHETLTYQHINGGGPKYLERPFLAKVPEIFSRLVRAIQDVGGPNVTLFGRGGPEWRG